MMMQCLIFLDISYHLCTNPLGSLALVLPLMPQKSGTHCHLSFERKISDLRFETFRESGPRSATSPNNFRKRLKTDLFMKA